MFKWWLVLAFTADIIYIVYCTDHKSNPSTRTHHDHSSRCNANEEFSKCPSAVCRPKYCSDVGFPVACPDEQKDESCCDKPACICREGYVRNRKGICIPIKECPSCGGDANAVSGCGVHCGNLCSNYDKGPVPCPRICYYNSCDCRKGYVYDENIKKCVKPYQCSPTCKLNEVYDVCPAVCPAQRCDVNPALILCAPNPKPGDKECKPSCRCKDNYLRNSTGHCIPENECPKCPVNEVYDVCPAPCPPRRCDVDERIIRCAKPPEVGDPDCKPGCRCQDGYKRNSDGVCIPKDQCTPFCNENEVASDCVNGGCGPKECSELGLPIKCVKPKICRKGCICRKGYLRNKDGLCIPKKKCPVVCGVDEIYNDCVNAYCSPQNCSQIGKPIACPSVSECFGGCVCKDGYLRALNGSCIPQDDCQEQQCPINEKYESNPESNSEPKYCTDLGFPLDPEQDCIENPGCFCIDGYVRNGSDVCIPKNNCPSCGGDPNAQSGCGAKCTRCSNYKDEKRACADICNINGCDCKKGYVYDDYSKKCVLPEECIECSAGLYEEYDPCPPKCPPQTCQSIGKIYDCPLQPAVCEPACRCITGYVRNSKGECVPEEYCKKCSGRNEEYDTCPPHCSPQTCASIGTEPNCLPHAAVCSPACRCIKGYFRNSKGECVPAGNCDECNNDSNAKPGCGINCGKRCSDIGKGPQACITLCKENACDCKDGYFLDDNTGKCVRRENCTICGGDPNAVPGCGINCGRLCSNYNKGPVACPAICNENGCDCKKHYVYDSTAKKCVKPKDCLPTTTPEICNETDVNQIKKSLAKLERGNFKMTGEFLHLIYNLNQSQSFVFSVISVMIALAPLTLYSVELASKQLHAALNLNNCEIRSAYPALTKLFNEQKNVTLTLNVKLYTSESYPLSNKFLEDSKQVCNAEAENINFNNKIKAADTINAWAANKTNNLIQKIVTSDMFDENTALLIINALYFLGNWEKQFDKNRTKKMDFYVTPNKTQSIDFMQQQARFKYRDNKKLNIQTLEMPYKGGDMRMIIHLPHEKDGLSNLIDKLKDPEQFNESVTSLESQLVDVKIPKFEINTSLKLDNLLKEINITAIFNTREKNFMNILKNEKPLFVSSAVQKAVIKVDEKGTEAAAVTAITVGVTSAIAPEPKLYSFRADHPFIFFVSLRGYLIFCGVFNGLK